MPTEGIRSEDDDDKAPSYNKLPYIKYRLIDAAYHRKQVTPVRAMHRDMAMRGISMEEWQFFWNTVNTNMRQMHSTIRCYTCILIMVFLATLIVSGVLIRQVWNNKRLFSNTNNSNNLDDDTTIDQQPTNWLSFSLVVVLLGHFFMARNYIEYREQNRFIDALFHHDRGGDSNNHAGVNNSSGQTWYQYFYNFGYHIEYEQQQQQQNDNSNNSESGGGCDGTYTLFFVPIVNDNNNSNKTATTTTMDSIFATTSINNGILQKRNGYYRIQHFQYWTVFTWTPIPLQQLLNWQNIDNDQLLSSTTAELSSLTNITIDDQWNVFWKQFCRLSRDYVFAHRVMIVLTPIWLLNYFVFLGFSRANDDGVVNETSQNISFLLFVLLTVAVLFASCHYQTQIPKCAAHIQQFNTHVAQSRGYHMEYRTTIYSGPYYSGPMNYVCIFPPSFMQQPSSSAATAGGGVVSV